MHDDESANLRRALYDAFRKRVSWAESITITFDEEAIVAEIDGVRWVYAVVGEDDEVLPFKSGTHTIRIPRPEGV